jgi:hypothetical protein
MVSPSLFDDASLLFVGAASLFAALVASCNKTPSFYAALASFFAEMNFFAKIVIFFETNETKLNISVVFGFLKRYGSLDRALAALADNPAAWRSGGFHYTLRGARLFKFARHFHACHCRHCAKPQVVCWHFPYFGDLFDHKINNIYKFKQLSISCTKFSGDSICQRKYDFFAKSHILCLSNKTTTSFPDKFFLLR